MKKKKVVFIFRLDEILKERGRGIREFSRSSGVGIATISRIVKNHTHGISMDVLGKICAELEIAPGELFRTMQK